MGEIGVNRSEGICTCLILLIWQVGFTAGLSPPGVSLSEGIMLSRVRLADLDLYARCRFSFSPLSYSLARDI